MLTPSSLPMYLLPTGEGHKFEVKSFVFPGEAPDKYRHEEQDWWVKQVRSIADSYLYWQFNYPENEIDYQDYRTFLRVTGVKKREDDTSKKPTPSPAWFMVLPQPT